MTLDLISLLIGGVLGAVISGMLVYLRRPKDSGFDQQAKEQLLLAFKSLSNEALDETTRRFLQVAEQNLKGHHQKAEADLDKRRTAIEEMLKPVGKSLDEFNKKITDFDKSHAGIHGEVKSLLTGLHQETKSLVEVLKTPPLRGNWGEVQLKRILEASGMVEQINYRTQVTVDNARPDIVVDMPGGGCIVIDSKAPMKAYFDALADGITQGEQKTFIAQHVDHVRKHVRDLSAKSYWEKFDGPEFVVMFFPSESALRLAQEADPNITHEAFQKNVLMASPLTLLGLLRVVSFGWRQVQMADNARKVSELGADLYKRIHVFAGHFQKVGSGLRTALGAYDSAVGSLERQLLSGARKFKDLHVVDLNAEEKHIEAINQEPRRITVDELDEQKEKVNEE